MSDRIIPSIPHFNPNAAIKRDEMVEDIGGLELRKLEGVPVDTDEN